MPARMLSHKAVGCSRSPELTLRAALAALWPCLFARAVKLSRDPTEAADLVQEAMLRALEFEHTYASGTNLKAWLQQVLFSVFASRCRRRQRERRALERVACDPCIWIQGEPEAPVQGLMPGVQAALRTLPEQFAVVVRLVDIEEQTYREAAERLGVPIGTVMSRLSRGRKLLADALAAPAQLVAAA